MVAPRVRPPDQYMMICTRQDQGQGHLMSMCVHPGIDPSFECSGIVLERNAAVEMGLLRYGARLATVASTTGKPWPATA